MDSQGQKGSTNRLTSRVALAGHKVASEHGHAKPYRAAIITKQHFMVIARSKVADQEARPLTSASENDMYSNGDLDRALFSADTYRTAAEADRDDRLTFKPKA